MYTIWTKHLKDQDARTRFQNSLLNDKWILEHLTILLGQMEQDLDTAELSPKTYDVPNWDYRQAHNNGYRQCLQLIKKLINLDHKENNDR